MKPYLHLCMTFLMALGVGCATQRTHVLYQAANVATQDVVTIIVPSELDVLAVDGQSVSTPLHFRPVQSQKLQVAPGRHTLSLRYYAVHDDPSRQGETTMWRIGPMNLAFDTRAGQVYTVTFKEPSDAHASQVELGISERNGVTETDKPVPHTPATATEEKASPMPAKVISQEPLKKVSEPVVSAPLRNLKEWWTVANEADRKAFLESIGR